MSQHVWRLKAVDKHTQQHECMVCRTVRTKVSLESSWPRTQYKTAAGLIFRSSAPPCKPLEAA